MGREDPAGHGRKHGRPTHHGTYGYRLTFTMTNEVSLDGTPDSITVKSIPAIAKSSQEEGRVPTVLITSLELVFYFLNTRTNWEAVKSLSFELQCKGHRLNFTIILWRICWRQLSEEFLKNSSNDNTVCTNRRDQLGVTRC